MVETRGISELPVPDAQSNVWKNASCAQDNATRARLSLNALELVAR
jgi:hypothetical protein